MLAKIILSMDGAVLKEYALNKERLTVGRKAHNDIQIDNLAVSGEHAAIVTILNDSFLEDLESTNGVSVNGTAVKKHFLKTGDVIEIGKYKLKYLNDQPAQTSAADFEKTMILRAPVHLEAAHPVLPVANPIEKPFDATGQFAPTPVPPPAIVEPVTPVVPKAAVAAIQILTGASAGRELELVKSLTTLGKPGLQVAVLTRRPHGFFITHVEGATYPTLNGQSLSDQPHPLNDHDIIELAGVKMEFFFKS
jgi:pSer/pThr/pTyr-binding forkhead associated (FHA) protein